VDRVRLAPELTAPQSDTSSRLRFSLPLEPARLLRARQRIRDYLHSQAVKPEAVDDIVLAIQEAMTNAVAHSAARADLEVGLHFEGADLVAEIRDHGVGFDIARFDPDRRPSLDEPSGRGLYLIAHLMDQVELRCDGGLRVRAVKRGARGGKPAESDAPPSLDSHADIRQRALLEEIDERFFSLDWAYCYSHVNEALARSCGMTREELIGASMWEAFPLLREREAGQAVRDAMELGLPSILEYVSPMLGRWHELRVYPVASGVSGYVRDITDRKLKELERDALYVALQESEASFSAIFEESPVAIALATIPEGVLVRANRAFEELFGFASEEVLGRTFIEIGTIDTDVHAAVNAVLRAHDRVRDFLCKGRTRSGMELDLSMSLDEVAIGAERYVLTTMRDVTLQRRAEDALRQKTADLDRAQEVGQIGSWRYDLRDDVLTWSRETYRILGVAPGSRATYETFLSMVHVEDRALVDAQWRAALGGSTYDVTHRIVVADRVRWLRGKAFLEFDEAGGAVAAFGIAQDVTERVEAEKALRDSEERLRLALDAASLVSFEWDIEKNQVRHFISSNPTLAGLAATEAPTFEAVREAVYPDDRETFDAAVAEALEREDGWYENEFRVVTADGEILWLQERGRVERDERGRPARLIGLSRDVSAQKRAERALRESEARLRLALRNTPVSVAIQDRDLRFVWAFNQRTAAPEDIIGKYDDDLFLPDEAARLRAIKRRVLEESVEVKEEMWLERPEGRVFLEIHFEPLCDETGRAAGVATAAVDRTPAKRAEEALREALAERTLLAEQRARQARQMSVLAEMARIASSALDVGELAERLVDAVYALLNPDLVSLAVPDGGGELHLVAVEGRTAAQSQGAAKRVPRESAVALAFHTGQPTFIERLGEWSLRERAASGIGGPSIQSCAVLPLATDGRPIGVLSIGWPNAHHFDFEEITLLDLMAAEIAVGLENALRYEVERRVAATLREHFVHPLPTLAGMDLALVSLPASQPELVGGDFHDVFEAHDGRVVTVIGDVMGKGMRAAGLAETVRSAVRALAFFSPSPGKILRDVNRLLLTLSHEEFTSALVVVLDSRTGRARMASAGHPPPAMVRGGTARLVEPVYGPVLGTIDASYEATEFPLPMEAALAMYTDGLIEARRDGELFGEKRVLEVLSEISDGRSETVARSLRDAVLGFAGTLRDDLEIVVVRRTRRGSP